MGSTLMIFGRGDGMDVATGSPLATVREQAEETHPDPKP